MSEKSKTKNKNLSDTQTPQVWKNPEIVKAVSGILSEIISENEKEMSSNKISSIKLN
jgi:hypothetical protein